MTKKERKILNCPICKRLFTQARSNQTYCCRGCAETAYGIRQIMRMVKSAGNKLVEPEVKD